MIRTQYKYTTVNIIINISKRMTVGPPFLSLERNDNSQMLSLHSKHVVLVSNHKFPLKGGTPYFGTLLDKTF